jgi:hypothetical protein
LSASIFGQAPKSADFLGKTWTRDKVLIDLGSLFEQSLDLSTTYLWKNFFGVETNGSNGGANLENGSN